jgi:hypothetical protein
MRRRSHDRYAPDYASAVKKQAPPGRSSIKRANLVEYDTQTIVVAVNHHCSASTHDVSVVLADHSIHMSDHNRVDGAIPSVLSVCQSLFSARFRFESSTRRTNKGILFETRPIIAAISAVNRGGSVVTLLN